MREKCNGWAQSASPVPDVARSPAAKNGVHDVRELAPLYATALRLPQA